MSTVKDCPKCGNYGMSVVDSRERKDYLHRSRKCLYCGFIEHTVEIPRNRYNVLCDTEEILHKINNIITN